jgi:hypothetical protein
MAKHRAAKKTTKKRGTKRKRFCKTACTICGNAYPKGPMNAKKYIAHVKKHHTSKIYC